MIKSSEVPSPFKVFLSTLVAQGPIYAFFINNKRSRNVMSLKRFANLTWADKISLQPLQVVMLKKKHVALTEEIFCARLIENHA